MRIHGIAVCGLAMSLLLSTALPAGAAGSLDGKVFQGQIGDKAKGLDQSQPDEFTFEKGKFSSKLCQTFGYEPGRYMGTASGNLIKFSAETDRMAGGKKIWSGMLMGSDIEGTCVTEEGGQKTEEWFKGRLKSVK